MTDRADPAAVVSVQLARGLAVLATAGLLGCVVFFWFWYTGFSPRPADLAELDSAQKQELVEELMFRSPGVYSPSLFAPELSYTLKPNQALKAWESSFTANAIGYRSGPVEKVPGTLRVVFVGDSWAYGMGVDEQQSFPAQLEVLANQHGGSERRIEAFTLALPGYNLMNSLGALDVFLDRLQPDAVVLCPTMNDIDSANGILPNGSQTRDGITRDAFGSGHSLRFRARTLDSHLFRLRWRMACGRIRKTEERLARMGIPVLIYFTAVWHESLAHSLVQEGGLKSTYLVTPLEFVAEEYRNPAPVRHGNPAGCRIYASMVYRGLAETLGWNLLPPDVQGPTVPVFHSPPPGDWAAQRDALLAETTLAEIPTTFEPSPAASSQAIGPLDYITGLSGRGTTVLVRRAPGAQRLVIAVKAVPELPSIYPMQLRVTIPSPSGGTRVLTTVPRDHTRPHRFELPIPEDMLPGRALDVIFEAERGGVTSSRLELRSFYLLSIVQNS